MRPLVLLLFFSILLLSCAKDKGLPDMQGYPEAIGKIFLNKCSTPGCHNEASKDAASGLSMVSWEKLFEGGRNGSAVIPYRHDQSILFYYCNSYADLGVQLSPNMPYGKPPLSRQEITDIINWINAGAKNDEGKVMFGESNLKKFYVTNQGCDEVSVFSTEKLLTTRYVKVGNQAGIEAPHMIRVSPDGKYWYVVFTGGNCVQKFRTSDDTYVGEISIGSGNWNTLTIAGDGKLAFCVDWSANGKIFCLDLENLTLLHKYQGSGLFIYPHASLVNNAGSVLYVSAQTGNFVYKLDLSNISSPDISEISLEQGISPSSISKLDIHDLIFTPDEKFYYASCQKSNELRVMQTSNDSLVAIIPTGSYPQEFAISEQMPYLFVTCPEDTLSFPGTRGSVSVIDYSTHTFVKKINTGFQPHGIGVDDLKKMVYVANRNVTTKGPAPHHSSSCGGRNGYITFIDMNSLTLIPNKRYEVSVDPYSIAVKNK